MSDDFFDDVETDLNEDLAAQDAARDADSWEPEEGDILKGIFLKADGPIPTAYGSTYVALVKDIEKDEIVKVWLSRTVLRNEFFDAAPKQGGRVAVRYVGERETASSGTSYHLYQVRVPENGSDLNYWLKLQQHVGIDKPDDDDDDGDSTQSYGPDEAPF